MYGPRTQGRKRVGLFQRPKPRRLKRGMVSLDDSLLAASARPAVYSAHQPLVRGLAIPLAAPTAVAPPIGGKCFVDRLDPKDVMAAPITDATLTAVLLGFAQVKPEGARKVVMTRHPSEDVVVRLYQETANGLIYPTWVLARSHKQAQAQNQAMNDDLSTAADERKSIGMLFCQYVTKALATHMKNLVGKPASMRLSYLVRCLTGRNLSNVSMADKDLCWEALLNAICERRPVYASTTETNPQHQKRRKLSAASSIVILEAFELRGERYVCVFDPEGAAAGTATTPKDMLLADLLGELEGLYVVA